MSCHILILACLLAVCLPILGVQLPRTTLFSKTRSKECADIRSQIFLKSTTIRRHPQQRPRHQQQTSSFGVDGTTSADSGVSAGEAARKQQATVLKASRKPWDPPFPKRETTMGTKNEWYILPPSLSQQRSEDLDQKGLADGSFPPNVDGDSESDELGGPELQKHDSIPGSASRHHPRKEARPAGTSVLWITIAGLAILLFLLAFAILIAHCLAWFLVYKTEARLGEARRGLLKGGDMRLCLCGT